MLTARTHNAIDLLKPTLSRDTRITAAINWALVYGRFILIFTELAVIGVFVARFSLDAAIADEKETLTRQQNIVTSLAQTEAQFRATYDRIALTKALLNKQRNPSPILSHILVSIPQGVTVFSVSLTEAGAVQFNGIAQSPETFRQLYQELTHSTLLTNVTLGTVAYGKEGVSFSVTAQAQTTPKETEPSP